MVNQNIHNVHPETLNAIFSGIDAKNKLTGANQDRYRAIADYKTPYAKTKGKGFATTAPSLIETLGGIAMRDKGERSLDNIAEQEKAFRGDISEGQKAQILQSLSKSNKQKMQNLGMGVMYDPNTQEETLSALYQDQVADKRAFDKAQLERQMGNKAPPAGTTEKQVSEEAQVEANQSIINRLRDSKKERIFSPTGDTAKRVIKDYGGTLGAAGVNIYEASSMSPEQSQVRAMIKAGNAEIRSRIQGANVSEKEYAEGEGYMIDATGLNDSQIADRLEAQTDYMRRKVGKRQQQYSNLNTGSKKIIQTKTASDGNTYEQSADGSWKMQE